MDANFWHQRWREGNIPFHEGRVNGYLKIYFDRLECGADDLVFVPLCGKAVDMKWIRERGCRVLGVELSPIASRDFFVDSGVDYAVEEEGGFKKYSGQGVELLCGDLFAMARGGFENVKAIYDRASYIAFDAAMRERYADFICSMLPRGAPVLLLTLDYPQDLMDGPPFAVGEDEVRERFEGRYDVAHLETRDIIEQQPHFQAKGLPTLLAHAFLLRDR